MPLQLYNSLTRRKEAFQPLDPDRVTMYACGPTVYNPPHIGNARAAVVFDLWYRVLMRHYDNVIYARNITDVDDKINATAADEDLSIREVAARYTETFHRDMNNLGVLTPSIEPRATEHIVPIIAMIERLIGAQHAYEADGHVLFHVPSFADYGKLSGRAHEEMLAGARVDVAAYKRDPADFVLWKPSSADLPGWESPWGRGRPGWHIECSAMAAQHLGTTIDIHGGGNDLKFPHHENEIAQSVCAHQGADLARYWLHNGFVEIDREKMSKSVGNVLLVETLLQHYPGEAIRLGLISTRYREPLNWDNSVVERAKAQLDRLYGALQSLERVELTSDPLASQEFRAAMDDDLNSALAISILMEAVKRANTTTAPAALRAIKAEILGGSAELGIGQLSPSNWFSFDPAGEVNIASIEALIAARQSARDQQDWARADQIRDELSAMGIQIQDGPSGTQWRTI